MRVPNAEVRAQDPSTDDRSTDDDPHLVLGPILRGTPGNLTVWVEASAPGEIEVAGHRSDTFTIADHHYALVDLDADDLDEDGGYTVSLNGETIWPVEEWPTPGPIVRPWSEDGPLSIMGGSCRQQAPDPLWRKGARSGFGELGPDVLATLSREIQGGLRPAPDLLILTGDQVYADEQHRSVQATLRRRRGGPPASGEPDVTSFDEYTWLYQRTWGHPLIRWLLSSVPSLMIFDDHDVIDDWNISESWMDDMAATPWWEDRIVNALASYWIYQHLGNLSPAQRQADELFKAVVSADDGYQALREGVHRLAFGHSDRVQNPWTHEHRVGPVHIIVLDTRNARVVEPSKRSMIGPPDWDLLQHALDPADGAASADTSPPAEHVLIVSSVPWALPDGIHRIQQLVSHLANGGPRYGSRLAQTIGERIRRAVDLEHWPAFGDSFERLRLLLAAAAARDDGPSSLVVLSGDVHFGYLADVDLGSEVAPACQMVSSPLRQIEVVYERGARQLAMSAFTRRVLGRVAQWSRSHDEPVRMSLTHGPVFDNNIAKLDYRPGQATATLYQATPGPADRPRLLEFATRELCT